MAHIEGFHALRAPESVTTVDTATALSHTLTSGSKETIWLACKQKTCCHAIIVPTGRDVWRIARAWDTPPWSFLIYFQTPVTRRDAFLLDQSGRRFRVALAKQPSRRTKTPAPCIFLLRTRQGHSRCALGALRPRLCQSYPSEMVNGLLSLRAGGCTCRAWALADVDITEERSIIETRQAEAEEYCTLVARWNERVLAAASPQTFDFPAFCAYLLEAYDAMAMDMAGGSR